MAPEFYQPLTDVRDVAIAHLNACLQEDAANKRFFGVNESVRFVQVGWWLRDAHGKDFPKCLNKVAPKCCFACFSCCSLGAQTINDKWNIPQTFENESFLKLLDGPCVPVKQSVLDMAASLIESKYIYPGMK